MTSLMMRNNSYEDRLDSRKDTLAPSLSPYVSQEAVWHQLVEFKVVMKEVRSCNRELEGAR